MTYKLIFTTVLPCVLAQLVIEHKYMENVEYFKYLVSMFTKDGRCVCGIESSIAMAKSTFNIKKALFTSKIDFFF
jgi:hypothetical protein